MAFSVSYKVSVADMKSFLYVNLQKLWIRNSQCNTGEGKGCPLLLGCQPTECPNCQCGGEASGRCRSHIRPAPQKQLDFLWINAMCSRQLRDRNPYQQLHQRNTVSSKHNNREHLKSSFNCLDKKKIN